MEKDARKSVEFEENTNPFPIHPDLDAGIDPADAHDDIVSDAQLTQEVEMINPDPNSLDRG